MNPEMISKYSSGTSTFFARLADTILRFRWLLLLLVAGLTLFAFYEMRFIKMDNSNEVWFVEGDRSLDLLDEAATRRKNISNSHFK